WHRVLGAGGARHGDDDRGAVGVPLRGGVDPPAHLRAPSHQLRSGGDPPRGGGARADRALPLHDRQHELPRHRRQRRVRVPDDPAHVGSEQREAPRQDPADPAERARLSDFADGGLSRPMNLPQLADAGTVCAITEPWELDGSEPLETLSGIRLTRGALEPPFSPELALTDRWLLVDHTGHAPEAR